MNSVIWRPMAIEIGIVFLVGISVGWCGHAIYTSPTRAKFTDIVQKTEDAAMDILAKDQKPLIEYGRGRLTINFKKK